MRRVSFVLLMLVSTVIGAQNISVSSFKLLENDLTANTYGTMVKDRNGEVSALIKVVTVERGFAFDGGMAGIVSTKQEVGEVWVYVPHGIKKITIKHPQLGVLRDYFFDIPIEKARTYEMVLATGQTETQASHALNKQFVVFEVKPADAVVELNGEVLSVDSEGYATKSMPFGTYDYRISRANYNSVEGKVTVNAQGKAEVKVELHSNLGFIKFDGVSEYHDANVYIDNVRVGQLPLTTSGMKSGTYQVKVAKGMYKTYEQQVTVQDNDTTVLNVELIPNFANVTLTTDANSEIWIDGERKGVGQWMGPLEIGDYMVETKRESHQTTSEIVQISSLEARTIQLKSPTPVYGILEISSDPLRATVYIDDKEVGETPLMLSNVLVGNRRILFKKGGYKPTEEMVAVKENAENRVSVNLEKTQGEVAATDKPEEKAPIQKPVKKDEAPKKEKKLRYMVGIEAKMSDKYSFDNFYFGHGYGGEVGIAFNRFSLIAGAESHIMGKYETWEGDESETHTEEHTIQLLRFSTKLGYTLGRRFQFTPQVGIVFGPSFLSGREYVMNELPFGSATDFISDRLLNVEEIDIDMNKNITDFARMRCGVLVGSRLGYSSKSGLGFHITPEYTFGEGWTVNAGLTIKF